IGLRQATRESIPVGTPNVFVVSAVRGYHPAWLAELASFEKDSEASVLFRVVWRSGPRHRQGRRAPP
ncbi:MAG: hypothetical protein WBF17_11505, partial [Phycisphaerae bacterium]